MDYLDSYPQSLLLGSLLKSRGQTLSVAESCTGGGLSEALTAVAGSSAYFLSGFITYTNLAKEDLLGVSSTLLDTYGAVSQEVAAAMAVGVLAKSSADYAVSITGIAGPSGGSQEKPVGLVWFGLADRVGHCITQSQQFGGGRHIVRRQSIGFVLQWLIDHIKSISTSTGAD